MNIFPETKLIRHRKFFMFLLYSLVFLAPLGVLSRALTATPEMVKKGIFILPGPTTVIAVICVAYGLVTKASISFVMRKRIFLSFFVFAGIALGAGILHVDAMNNVIRAAMFVMYSLLMVFTIVIYPNYKERFNLIFFTALGTSLMLVLSLVDYLGIYNIPLINERSISINIEELNTKFKTLCGPFRSRSELSAFLCVILPPCIASLFLPKTNLIKRLCILVAVFLIVTAVIVSASRGMYLAVILSFGYIILNAIRVGYTSKLFYILPIIILGIISILIKSPDYLLMLISRFGDLNITDIAHSESDMIRIYAFQDTFKDVTLRPWGIGFTGFEKFGRLWDVHSIFTEFFRAAGFIGVAIILNFIIKVQKFNKMHKKNPFRFMFLSAFIGFLVYNIGHSYWQVTILWIFMGCYFCEIFSPAGIHRR